MSSIEKHVKSEARQLPLMVGKTVGGIMAGIGFPYAIFILARRPEHTTQIVIACLAGIFGIIIFTICSRALKKIPQDVTQTPKEKIQESTIAWLVLLILAVLFIFVTYLITV